MTVSKSVGEKILLELHSFDFVISQNFDGKYNMNPWTRSEAYIWFYRQRTDCKQIAVHQLCKALNVNFMCSQVFLGTACQHFSFISCVAKYFWVLLVNIFHSVCPLHGNDRYCDMVILGHLSILFGKGKYVWGISIGTCFQYPINLT